MSKYITLAVLVVASVLGIHGNALAADQIHRSFDLPAALSLSIQTTACAGTPGPQVSLQGDLTLTGLNASVIFRNTGPQVSQEPFSVNQVIVPADQKVSTPAQSITGGLGNNPYIWLQVADSKGRPLTGEIFLGRCDQGTFTPAVNIAVPADATGTIVASGCGGASGPTVTLDGGTELSPLMANLIFRSADPASTPKGKIDQVVNQAMIFPAGQSYPLPTQPIVANSAANPLVSMQFSLEGGATVGSEVRFGRCSTIANP